jgi:alpha-tubulin suppressor-like RCC1 family protein
LVRNSANSGNLSNIVQVASGVAFPNYVKNPSNTGELNNIASISVDNHFTLALANDGTVYGWGWNGVSQLGNGITNGVITTLPSQVLTAAGSPLTGVVAISAGYENGIALTYSGKVYMWGSGSGGALGQGGSTYANSAYAIPAKTPTGLDMAGIAAIAAGGSHMLALTTTGTVWAWGSRTSGQLGEGLAVTLANQSFIPLQVVKTDGTGALSNIIGIKARSTWASCRRLKTG